MKKLFALAATAVRTYAAINKAKAEVLSKSGLKEAINEAINEARSSIVDGIRTSGLAEAWAKADDAKIDFLTAQMDIHEAAATNIKNSIAEVKQAALEAFKSSAVIEDAENGNRVVMEFATN